MEPSKVITLSESPTNCQMKDVPGFNSESEKVHLAEIPVLGISPFTFLPKDLLLKIFSYLPEYVIQRDHTCLALVCWRWFRILANINEFIKIYPFVKGSYDSPYRVRDFLKATAYIPTEETVKLIDLTWLERKSRGNDLMFLFLSTYLPKRWKYLPLPSWSDVVEYLRGQNFGILSLMGDSLDRCGEAFLHLHGLLKANEILAEKYQYLKFPASILLGLGWAYQSKRITIEFIDWFIHQSFCQLSPRGLVVLVEKEIPFEYIQRYVELPITIDWNPHSSEEYLFTSEERVKSETYKQVFLAYKSRLTVTEQNGDDLKPLPLDSDMMKGFCYFSKRVNAKIVKNALRDMKADPRREENRKRPGLLSMYGRPLGFRI